MNAALRRAHNKQSSSQQQSGVGTAQHTIFNNHTKLAAGAKPATLMCKTSTSQTPSPASCHKTE